MVAAASVRAQWVEAITRHDLIRWLISQRPRSERAKQFGAYRIEPGVDGLPHPALPVARLAEADIFWEHFQDPPEWMEAEYGPFDPFSTFFVILRHDPVDIVDMLRIIRRSPLGLKSLTDIESTAPGRHWCLPLQQVLEATGVWFDPATTLDMATMGVAKAYERDPRFARATYHLACAYTLEECGAHLEQNGAHWVTIVDEKAHRSFRQSLGDPFSYFTGLTWKPYFGSPSSLPVFIDFPTWIRRLKLQDLPRFRRLVLGEGLSHISLPSLPRFAEDGI